MRTLKVTIALLAGMAAGAVIGLLFAPQTGSETRDQLSASLDSFSNRIKGTAAALPDPEAADDLEHA